MLTPRRDLVVWFSPGSKQMQNELVAPHKVDRNTEHYAAIKAEMAKRGECVIRAMWSDELGYWFAIEGSHRCAAAEELGIEIQIHDIGSDDDSEWVTDLDGCNVARDWEWLTDYLVSYRHVNESAIYSAVQP
jgi:hypothetical protein